MGIVAGVLCVVALGVYEYQPQRFDLFPRRPPSNNPWTDPDTVRLMAAGTRVTVITAHPDDAEFYIGGLLAKLGDLGVKLSLIVMTDGDKGYYPFEDAEKNRRVRRQEQQDAASLWHADEVIFLGYPDGRLFATPEVVSALAAELDRLQPEYVLAFDPLYPPRLSHRDHRDAGEASERAVKLCGSTHWLLEFSTRAPNFAVDVTQEWSRKLDLLHVHKSQFSGDKLQFIDGIVSRSAGEYGRMLNVSYAEGLRCIRLRQARSQS